MRVREIFFRDFRNFRGEHRISFVDPLTDSARAMMIIAGTNGTGKTTILETIVETTKLLLRQTTNKFFTEAYQSGLIEVEFEFQRDDLQNSQVEQFMKLRVRIGQSTKLMESVGGNASKLDCASFEDGKLGQLMPPSSAIVNSLQEAVSNMQQGQAELRGGVVYFPQNRRFDFVQSRPGGIRQSVVKQEWITIVTGTNKWQGSLEELWVWQNYLDLEQRNKGQQPGNLKSFVATVESLLGPDRKIAIENGRVTIPASPIKNGYSTPTVRLDQLPSGERQTLETFGELARHRRPGGVVLIDEPEISLHPTMQRLVIHQLRDFAREWDAQVILATHSIEVLRSVLESERINLDHLDAKEATPELP